MTQRSQFIAARADQGSVNAPLTGLLQRKCACGGSPGVDSECAGCRDTRLQRNSGQRGQALQQTSQPSIEVRFPHDFGDVRVTSGSPLGLQTKLTVSEPGDVFEHEADQMADHVMGSAEPSTTTREGSSASVPTPGIQRSCAACAQASSVDEDPPLIMRKGLEGEPCQSTSSAGQQDEEQQNESTPLMAKAEGNRLRQPNRSIEGRLEAGTGGGSLSQETRAFMESRFGYDFGAVRVHTDSDADWIAKDLNAEAFTVGHDIYFGPGRYSPHTRAGQWLLAHELTHVAQQSGGNTSGAGVRRFARAAEPVIQRFTLKGFPPAEESLMKAAVPAAKSVVSSCAKLSASEQGSIGSKLDSLRYDYVPDLGLCGWTFPASWYIQVGKSAFNVSTCCTLASTLAHEASHTKFFTESGARKLECDCFGCSCPKTSSSGTGVQDSPAGDTATA
jgi:Domain of unknown function (DUF4157)